MAANVLNSPQAVEMSVVVVRAFVRMRHMLSAHKELTELKIVSPAPSLKVAERRRGWRVTSS
jgi:hypothetical protein